jgi:hypothetical protein
VGITHPEQSCLGVHRFHEHFQPARIGTPKQLSRAVLGRHQCEVQRRVARHLHARTQVRTNVGSHNLAFRDRQFFVQRQVGIDRDERRHQLGDRRDRQYGMRVFLEQHFVSILIHDQCNRRLQLERILGTVQAGQLTL